MPNIEGVAPPARKALHIFYVLDTSGSMGGEKIAVLNRAMTDTVDALKGVAEGNADAQLKIAVLEFNSYCRWVQPNGPENLEDFIWVNLSATGGTDVAAALTELNSKMSRNAFLDSMTGAALPIVIFMSDGQAAGYQSQLEQIRRNKWFVRATKIGLAIGNDADVNMIADVVGNSEAVVRPGNLESFARLIKFVSVTSSMLNSQSQVVGTNTSGSSVVQTALEQNVIDDSEVVRGAGTIPPEDPNAMMVGDDDYDDWTV